MNWYPSNSSKSVKNKLDVEQTVVFIFATNQDKYKESNQIL